MGRSGLPRGLCLARAVDRLIWPLPLVVADESSQAWQRPWPRMGRTGQRSCRRTNAGRRGGTFSRSRGWSTTASFAPGARRVSSNWSKQASPNVMHITVRRASLSAVPSNAGRNSDCGGTVRTNGLSPHQSQLLGHTMIPIRHGSGVGGVEEQAHLPRGAEQFGEAFADDGDAGCGLAVDEGFLVAAEQFLAVTLPGEARFAQ